MSIRIVVSAAGLSLQASLKDEALPRVVGLIQEFREEQAQAEIPAPAQAGRETATASSSHDAVTGRLKIYGAGELLNLLKFDTYPEKILLLGGWHEAHGGQVPWKSSDLDVAFGKAKDPSPQNFGRDIGKAIKKGWIHASTSRTYAVSRTGWNKLEEDLRKVENPSAEK